MIRGAMLSLRLFSLSVVLHLRLTVDWCQGAPTWGSTTNEKWKWERGQELFFSVISPTRWTGFYLLTVWSSLRPPPRWVSSFLHSLLHLFGVQKYLNTQHHNRGDRQVGRVKKHHTPQCLHATRLNTQEEGRNGVTALFYLGPDLLQRLFWRITMNKAADDHRQRGVNTWNLNSGLWQNTQDLKKKEE